MIRHFFKQSSCVQLHSKNAFASVKVKVNPFASSEIGNLKKVLVHRPTQGVGRIMPKNAQQFLFDDIVNLQLMQKQHDTFTQILKAFVGDSNVLQIRDLLKQTIQAFSQSREMLTKKIQKLDKISKNTLQKLESLSNEQFTNTVLSGYSRSLNEDLLTPMSNLTFTRDIAITINKHILITKAAKMARMREHLVTGLIMNHHPSFTQAAQESRLIEMGDQNIFKSTQGGQNISLEGGDVMTIHKDYLLVGHSQRTTGQAFTQLRKTLFERNVIKNVVQINIPEDRSCMHIDTIFTQINYNHIVGYKPLVVEGNQTNVTVHRSNGQTKSYRTIAEFFRSEINQKIEFILGGGGKSPFQEREQWTDSCNMVALKPGVALNYDRNPETDKALQIAGYNIIHASQLLKNIKSGKTKAEDVKNTIIRIPSCQLSRARGGSHCMTCPIQRQDV